MRFRIYKPGQGYWTRMLSAIAAATLILATAAWTWREIGTRVGTAGGSITLTTTQVAERLAAWGDAAGHPIADVNRIRSIDADAPQGEPTPTSFNVVGAAGDRAWRLDAASFAEAINFAPPGEERETRQTVAGDISEVGIDSGTVTITPRPGFFARNAAYVQVTAFAIIVLGLGATGFYVMNKPAVAEFMIATEMEMKKVNWPSRREVIGSTWVVICGTFLMAGILWVTSLGFGWLFTEIGILQS